MQTLALAIAKLKTRVAVFKQMLQISIMKTVHAIVTLRKSAVTTPLSLISLPLAVVNAIMVQKTAMIVKVKTPTSMLQNVHVIVI